MTDFAKLQRYNVIVKRARKKIPSWDQDIIIFSIKISG